MHTIVYGMDGQWGPTVKHRELYQYSVITYIYEKKNWKKMDVCICISESLCCIAEIIMTL